MLSERSRGFNSAGVQVYRNGSIPCPSHWILLRILLAAGDMASATAVSATFCMVVEVEFLPAFTSFACSGPLKPILNGVPVKPHRIEASVKAILRVHNQAQRTYSSSPHSFLIVQITSFL